MPKRYLTGEGKPKNLRKSNNYLFRTLNNVKNWIKEFARGAGRFLTPQREGELLNSRGVILIEFAVCMPVLIILLFYINDLVKIRRLYSQTEFVGQQIANIIQNISKKRSDKTITLDDLKRACALAWLSASPNSGEAAPYTNIYYVKSGSVETQSAGCPDEAPSSGCTCVANFYQCGNTSTITVGQTKSDADAVEGSYMVRCKCSGQVYLSPSSGFYGCTLSLQLPSDTCKEMGFCESTPQPGRYTSGEEWSKLWSMYREFKANHTAIPIETTQTVQLDPGKVACAWGIGLNRDQNGTWTKDGDTISSDKSSSTIRWGENADPSAIYPTLTISDNQKKIIVETQFRLDSGDAKKAFGCYLVNPKSRVPDGSMYFTSVVTFEPKAGLFTATVPS